MSGRPPPSDDFFGFDPEAHRDRLEPAPASVAAGTPRERRADDPDLPTYLASLNPPQREASLHTEGPLIVLAGAGSGKTKMLTSRIAYLIEGRGISPHQILAVTFTNKAAAEMRERVERTLNGVADELGRPGLRSMGGRAPVWSTGPMLGHPELGTFHSVCTRLLRREMQATPFTKPFVIYDDSDQLQLVKATLEKLGINEKVISPKAIQGSINRMKCDATEPQDLNPEAHNVFEKHLARAYAQYQKDLFANNALDFGEIITMAYRILRDHVELREKYQRRWRYLHVDEYQDTNRAQYLLLSLLASPAHGGHGNICVVGDEDQSIYKWRGADIRNILDFERDFGGAHVVKLEQNYRSTQTIIQGAAAVIRNNTQRRDKTLWTDNDRGRPIRRFQVADERAEAELVIQELKKYASQDQRAFDEFAIFYRTNAQSRQFEDVLRREKLPYQIVGGLRFYDRKEIKDLLCYLRVLLNPADSVSMKRILNVPARGIGKSTADRVDAAYASLSQNLAAGEIAPTYLEVLARAGAGELELGSGPQKKIQAFVQLMARFQEAQPRLLLSELYHLILDETGYVRELRAEGTEESLARIENLEEFDTLVQEFEEDWFRAHAPELKSEEERRPRGGELLPTFIEQTMLATDLAAQRGETPVDVPSVKMMTLHSSKGLEFPVVFLVGMEEGLFPSIRQGEEAQDADIEEERRLCYVGLTRAREDLVLSSVAIRRFWGNVNYQEPSRFFLELPEDLVEFRDLTRGSSLFAGSRTPVYGANRGAAGPAAAPAWRASPPAPIVRRASGGGAGGDLTGRRLVHPEYGPGRILAQDGTGEDLKVTVEFAGRTQRKFMYRYVAEFVEE